MRDHFERLHQVQQSLEVLLPLEASHLGSKGSFTRRSLRTHSLAAEEARESMLRFPCPCNVHTRPHPDPDDRRKQANGPDASIALRQEDDENQAEDVSPSPNQLKLSEQSGKGAQCFFGKPCEGPRRNVP